MKKLFRLRFVVIGLLMCVFHVWCRTTPPSRACGTDLTDPASSAHLAQVVLIGKVTQKIPLSEDPTTHKVTVQIRGKGTLKGEDILKGGRKNRPSEVTIGGFGDTEDRESCINQVDTNSVYIFFLNTTSVHSNIYFKNSAMVIPEKQIKKAKKEISKVVNCRPGRVCVKPPLLNPKRALKDKKVKFRRSFQLKCSLRGKPMPAVLFVWKKDGRVLDRSNLKRGMSIRHGKRSSRLKLKDCTSSDAGAYECIAKNVAGELRQTSVITVVGAPRTKKPCEKKDSQYCLNNGTCEILLKLDTKMCTCRPGYGGKRCTEWILIDKAREGKLAQDRTLVVVGIISGILLFIAICVASYFLAKRRRERFYVRQRERKQRPNIEDIPPVYRPLIACDDVDGRKKPRYSGVIIHKETQTTETCFLEATADGEMNLYINPLENYIRPDRKDKDSRSRLTAVSLEGESRPRSNTDTARDTPDGKPDDSPDENKRDERDQTRPHANNHGNPGDGSPARANNSFQREGNPKYELGKDVPLPPSLHLETDSEDENPVEETPLTPLHISEDEDEVGRRGYGKAGVPYDKPAYPNGISVSGPAPPDYDTAMGDDEKLYASTSSSGYSDSSTPTSSGGDSQDGRYPYIVHTYSDPTADRYWNERGSPERRAGPTFFSSKQDDVPPPPPPDYRDHRSPIYANSSSPKYKQGPGVANRGDVTRIRDVRTDQAPVAL